MERKVIIRCDAGNSPKLGTGHLQRSLWLADELRKRNAQVIFLTTAPIVVSRAKEKSYRVFEITKNSETTDTVQLIQKEKPDMIVWDCLNSSAETMSAIKETGTILMTMDDRGEGQKLADVTINSTVLPAPRSYSGFPYVVLPEKIREVTVKPTEKVERVLLSFGGYDHADLTYKVLSYLQDFRQRFEFNVVVGSTYASMERLQKLASTFSHLEIHQGPKNFNQLLRSTDMAILNGGHTLLQALSLGIPTLAVGQYDHQVNTIERLEKDDAVISLGAAISLTEEKLKSSFERLVQDPARRKILSAAGTRAIDSDGLKRVADLVVVVDQLKFDSEFFGRHIAMLHAPLVNENLMTYALNKCRQDSVDCLYYRCDTHDADSILLAEKHGFHLVDVRLSFFRELYEIDDDGAVFKAQKVGHRPATENDIPTLRRIAARSYPDTRFYFDGKFPKEACDRLYADWVENSFRGEADHVIVAEVENDLLGFICCKIKNMDTGQITLVSVSEHAKGQAVGNTLVARALEWFKAQGLTRVESVTPGRNYFLQRLYEKCGFRTLQVELWYHKWFR